MFGKKKAFFSTVTSKNEIPNCNKNRKNGTYSPLYRLNRYRAERSSDARHKTFGEVVILETFIGVFNFLVFLFFLLLYSYQIVYIGIGIIKNKKKFKEASKLHHFAFVIAARNESNVIGELIESIKLQKYPKELIDIFVVADNCTDNTAEIARNAGATVYERFSDVHVGKGYALDFIFNRISTEHADKGIEAFLIFDADNVIKDNYVLEMNKAYDAGYEACTSYRNSKNYGTNWISAGYSLWFLREAKFLNNPRFICGTNCAVSGTGFMVSKRIIDMNGGWKYNLLTEDIEFSVDSAVNHIRIGYVHDAEFFDEQPETFSQSWKQRMRWAKGFYQVLWHYGGKLFKGMVSKKFGFACYDMMMNIMPALILSLFCLTLNTVFLIIGLVTADSSLVTSTLVSVMYTIISFYGTLFIVGLITTVSEWEKIDCSPAGKILYTFTFPIFMFTYVPIAVVAIFKKVGWAPIKHSVTKSIKELNKQQ